MAGVHQVIFKKERKRIMGQNCCVPKKETKKETLTNTLMDTGQMLSDLDKLVKELSGKLHGISKITAEDINAKELLDKGVPGILDKGVPGILEVADKNMQTTRTLYARLSELVAKL